MCRNHKHSYIPITGKQRAKLRASIHNCYKENKIPRSQRTKLRASIHNCYKENKIPRNITNKGCKGPLQGELQTTAQGNKRGHKQMEKHSMLMVRKNQ